MKKWLVQQKNKKYYAGEDCSLTTSIEDAKLFNLKKRALIASCGLNKNTYIKHYKDYSSVANFMSSEYCFVVVPVQVTVLEEGEGNE